MEINSNIFRSYDIRGVAGEDLTPENVNAIGKAYGTFLRARNIREAVVGRDCRLSSPEFHKCFIDGLVGVGVNVYDIGMTMVQCVYSAQYRLQVNGGAMITASHNPARYNGFKLAVGYSKTTEGDDLENLLSIINNENFFESKEQGTVTKYDYSEEYKKDILKRIRISRPLKIVIDSGNGTTGPFIPDILRRAGFEVSEYNTNPDGNFPLGTPDPTSTEMINRLSNHVVDCGADIGFGFDADGDRVGVVDENGDVIWNDVLVAMFAKDVLSRFNGAKIIYNNLCSQVVRKTIEKEGGVPIMWLTGHAHIKSKIEMEKSPFGGELSGHFFFADNFYGHDDGCFAMMRLLEYVTSSDKKLSELVGELPSYISSPEIKVGCPDDDKRRVMSRIASKMKSDFPDEEFSDETTIPGNDGVRIDFSDGMVVIRYSQNGPYITVKFEANNEQVYESRKKYVRNILKEQKEMVWDGDLAVNLEALE